MAAPYMHTTLCNFVRNISTNISAFVQRAQLKLGEVSSFLSSTISQFFDFVRCTVFYFISYCVTVHKLYKF